jgi:hypothetical protein
VDGTGWVLSPAADFDIRVLEPGSCMQEKWKLLCGYRIEMVVNNNALVCFIYSGKMLIQTT